MLVFGGAGEEKDGLEEMGGTFEMGRSKKFSLVCGFAW